MVTEALPTEGTEEEATLALTVVRMMEELVEYKVVVGEAAAAVGGGAAEETMGESEAVKEESPTSRKSLAALTSSLPFARLPPPPSRETRPCPWFQTPGRRTCWPATRRPWVSPIAGVEGGWRTS
jgi:hypothetical protein